MSDTSGHDKKQNVSGDVTNSPPDSDQPVDAATETTGAGSDTGADIAAGAVRDGHAETAGDSSGMESESAPEPKPELTPEPEPVTLTCPPSLLKVVSIAALASLAAGFLIGAITYLIKPSPIELRASHCLESGRRAGRVEDAVSIYLGVVRGFPQTHAADTARKRLDAMRAAGASDRILARADALLDAWEFDEAKRLYALCAEFDDSYSADAKIQMVESLKSTFESAKKLKDMKKLDAYATIWKTHPGPETRARIIQYVSSRIKTLERFDEYALTMKMIRRVQEIFDDPSVMKDAMANAKRLNDQNDISILMRQADEAQFAGDIENALSLYREAETLQPSNEKVAKRVESAVKKIMLHMQDVDMAAMKDTELRAFFHQAVSLTRLWMERKGKPEPMFRYLLDISRYQVWTGELDQAAEQVSAIVRISRNNPKYIGDDYLALVRRAQIQAAFCKYLIIEATRKIDPAARAEIDGTTDIVQRRETAFIGKPAGKLDQKFGTYALMHLLNARLALSASDTDDAEREVMKLYKSINRIDDSADIVTWLEGDLSDMMTTSDFRFAPPVDDWLIPTLAELARQRKLAGKLVRANRIMELADREFGHRLALAERRKHVTWKKYLNTVIRPILMKKHRETGL